MHVDDFREDLKPSRGQWEQIAREMCRVAGEAAPSSRLGATNLLLRLRESDPPDPAPDPAAAAPTPASAPQGIGSVIGTSVRLGGRRR